MVRLDGAHQLARQHELVLAAALDLGLSARSIVEILIQIGIYAGFAASEEAVGAAAAAFAARGLALPEETDRDDGLEALTARGRASHVPDAFWPLLIALSVAAAATLGLVVALGIFGASLAPSAATFLAKNYGLQYVGYYLCAGAVLSIIGLIATRETAHETL